MSEFSQRKSLMFKTWANLIISIIVVAAICAALITFSRTAQLEKGIVIYTGFWCVIASFVSILFVRSLVKYPGVEEFQYIIPSFCFTYAGVAAGLIFTRIHYSRFVLFSSFISSIIAFGIIYLAFRRGVRLRIGVIPEGEYVRLVEISGVDWRMLDHANTDVAGLDAVSADLWADLPDQWERQLASYALRGVPVYHSKHLRESLTGRVEIEKLSENTFGTLSPLYTYMAIKRFVDMVTAAIALVALAPFFVVLGLLIRFDSEGPALFSQVRIGYQGRPFRVFKFRTMTAAPDANGEDSSLPRSDDGRIRDAAMTKEEDKRITRLGKLLRRTRIDELPQILNVIKGEMSWIGPRPEAQVLSQWYENEIPFYRYRHIVRPGITGWAQVHQGHVANVDQVQEKLHFDFYYIKNFSPWIDIVVIARTVRTILTGFGAK